MLTRRARWCLVLAALFLIAGRVLGVTELFGLAAADLVVVITAAVRVSRRRVAVALTARISPETVTAGEPAVLELTVENTGPSPLAPGSLVLNATSRSHIAVEVPRLVPGDAATAYLPLPTTQRGRHSVTGFEALLSDGLGLARRRLAGIGTTRYGVRPPIEELESPLPLLGARAGAESARSAADRLVSGTAFLRPYQPGDDLRRVHWRTTARLGELTVREGGERDEESVPGVVLVLSRAAPRGAPDSFERAVSVAASVLAAASREGLFRLVVPFGPDTGEGWGPVHLERALEVLTDIAPLKASSVPGSAVDALDETMDDRAVVIVVSESASPAIEKDALEGVPFLVELSIGAGSSAIETDAPGRVRASLRSDDPLGEIWSLSALAG